MDISYFQKINNTYKSKSKQETDLYVLNRHVDECFDETIDYHIVRKNGEPFELLIIKDTDGNTFKKKIKSKNSKPFNLGDYIEWNNQIWLVTLLDVNDKTYHSGYMYLCTIPLRWQNSSGKIIERYAYSEDFTKYSGGTRSNNIITIGDNQYGLTLPVDEETKKLKRDMRFPIDFEDSEQPDIYELGNRKVNLNNYEYFNRGAIMTITLSYDVFNADTDKFVTMDNGKNVWICNYKDCDTTLPSKPNETDVLRAKINGSANLKIGKERTYTAKILDEKGNILEWNDDFSWKIICDFKIDIKSENNTLSLFIDDDQYIDDSFLLQVINNNTVIGELSITIVDIF